jgi:hypothetical protein
MLILVLVACGINNVSISISPGQATVSSGATVQFSASVTNAGNKTVLWSTTGGTITTTGLFTAPTSTGTCYVVATSQADGEKTATAIVTVVAPVIISPGTALILPQATQAFTATVPGFTNNSVTWSVVEATGGSIDAAGLYTAPYDEGTYHVQAVSVADPTRTAQAPVTVQGSVVVSPNGTVLAVNTTQAFSAADRVSGATAMDWTIYEGAAGGTIDATGLYTAPATPGTYHVVATNQADNTRWGAAIVIVTP